MLVLLLACFRSPPIPVEDHGFAREGTAPVRFVALGDVGKGNDTQKKVAKAIGSVCGNAGCNFALLLGDNLYPDGMTEPEDPRMNVVFDDVYGGLGLDFYAVLGNHDYGRQHVVQNARYQLEWASAHDRFHMPRSYYRFRAGNAAFWALDTDAVFWEGVDPQGSWLDETLGPVEAEWKVVYGHHPYRSNGRHGNAGSYEGWSGVPYASGAALQTLFDDHLAGRAHLYLAGHDHNLQSLDHKGLELIVSGAGASARAIEDRGNVLRAGHDVPGFAWVELGHQLTVDFYDAEGRLLSHNVIDKPRLSPR